MPIFDRYSCTLCKFRSFRWSRFAAHLRDVHAVEEGACAFCGKSEPLNALNRCKHCLIAHCFNCSNLFDSTYCEECDP